MGYYVLKIKKLNATCITDVSKNPDMKGDLTSLLIKGVDCTNLKFKELIVTFLKLRYILPLF